MSKPVKITLIIVPAIIAIWVVSVIGLQVSGNNAFIANKLPQAGTYYGILIKIDPLSNAAIAYSRLGYIELQNNSAVIDNLSAGRSDNVKNNSFAKAISYYEKAIQLGSNAPSDYFNLGQAYYYSYLAQLNTGSSDADPTRAEFYLQKASTMDPNNLQIAEDLGTLYYDSAKYAEAIQQLERVKDNPNFYLDTKLPMTLALSYMWNSEQDKAIGIFENMKNDSMSTSTLPAINDWISVSYRKLKEYQQAIDIASGIIKTNPDFANAYYDRGLAYWDRKSGASDATAAAADFNKYLQLEPNGGNASNAKTHLQEISESGL